MKQIVNISLEDKIEKFIEDVVEDDAKNILYSLADDVIFWSTPTVDTGAYITSFSFNVGAGRPRGKSSKNKPRRQSPQQKASEGRENLQRDIDKLPDLINKEAVQLRNEAPHAQVVEDKHGYKVFAKVRREYG
ncbi:hypothetical protein N9C03_00330 [bacterium]|nr:hypothetical protein [bacterium]